MANCMYQKERYVLMSKNTNLHEAKKKANDEWYTQKNAIEAEIKYYWNHFKGKIVYCNCDDPYESEFFKYFMIRFEMLGLKGLYATCYEGSQMSQHQLQLFEDEEYKGIPYKIEIYQKDIDQLKEEYNGTLSQETIKLYIKKHKKAKRLKGNGSFDSPECLKLLEKADIVVTNEPFSLTIPFINLLMEYNKKFLIIANKNAITYKEVFPLFKDNKLWLGYTQPKEFMTPTGEISKKLSGLTRWFTNLDIPKRHDDLILWKKYSPDEYPHYDNYDAINVDKVAEIPCDYCESWGLYPEEYEVLDKTQWEEVRREPKDETELIYVIPAKNTELRQALHDHSEGYKEKIEAELANVIYCNGVLGVPITYVDKANSKQFEILEGDDYRKKTLDSIPEECHPVKNQEPRTKNQEQLELHIISRFKGKQFTAVSLSERYCNGVIGTPITFLDKWSPEQFELFGATESEGTGFSNGLWYSNSKIAQPLIRTNRKYKRLFIQKIL